VFGHAPGAGRHQARDDAQERGLPAAGFPQDGDEFALPHLEVDVLEGNGPLVVRPENLGDPFDADHLGHPYPRAYPKA